ncbi:MAG: hypothetical protein JWO60_3140 [Frankiales bacterium]|nr:hypothetical protein [Frankiales bacterium]
MADAASWARRLLTHAGVRDVEVADVGGSSPVADWAASGAMALTGRRDGPPLVAPGAAATCARGALLALDALAGGPLLGIEGHRLLGERAALAGLRRSAPWSAGGSCRALAAADGWVAFSLARRDDDELLPALVQGDVHGDRWDVVARWARTRPAQEVAGRARLLGLVASTVPDQPTATWPPWDATSSPGGLVPDRPLVLDLSALWAGPLCASLLGAAGAQVVRVESTARPDGGRRGSAAFDDLLHGGQPSVALAFGTPDGRAQLHDLVARADVVVTSARPRALAQLGLDPDRHLAQRGAGVWVAVTAHPPGADGDVATGYGDDAAMSAGVVRWLDGVPVPCGDALADPLTGLHAAVAALAGLRTGGRHHVRIALSQVVASTVVMSAVQPGALPEASRGEAGWEVEGVPVAEPGARAVGRAAQPLGADTGAWT